MRRSPRYLLEKRNTQLPRAKPQVNTARLLAVIAAMRRYETAKPLFAIAAQSAKVPTAESMTLKTYPPHGRKTATRNENGLPGARRASRPATDTISSKVTSFKRAATPSIKQRP
jgi:hypothetical protein